jgi:hypothetical protein
LRNDHEGPTAGTLGLFASIVGANLENLLTGVAVKGYQLHGAILFGMRGKSRCGGISSNLAVSVPKIKLNHLSSRTLDKPPRGAFSEKDRAS